MTGDAALINLVRRTLRRLEEEMSPQDPALQDLKHSAVESVARLTLVEISGNSPFPDSKTA